MSSPILPDKAQQILNGTMAEKLRSGIAAGAVPMPPVDLVSCLAVMAAKDANPDLRTKATATLAELPAQVRLSALEAPLAAPIFRVIQKHVTLDVAERTKLVLNNDAPDDVITELAKTETDGNVLGILAENQTRMLRDVSLVEALLDNVSIGPAMQAKLEEFFSRAYASKIMLQKGLVTKDELASQDDWDDDLLEAVDDAAQVKDTEDDACLEEFIKEDEQEVEDEEEAAKLLAAASGDAEKQGEEEIDMSNLRQAVMIMTVPQKIKLALMGGKEARSLLVKDGNKVVSSMVLKNARISEKEVVAIAQSKTIREDMIRQISRNKKFMKGYAIKVVLVENPKTPIPMAMQLLTQLRDGDLKNISKSKSVSSNIANQAKRILKKKQK